VHDLHELQGLALDAGRCVAVVGVADAGDGERRARVGVQRRGERGQVLSGEQVVGRQVGDVGGGRVPEPRVERRPQAPVVTVPDEADPRVGDQQRLDRAGRAVVHHHCLPLGQGLIEQAPHGGGQERRGPLVGEVDRDDDGDPRPARHVSTSLGRASTRRRRTDAAHRYPVASHLDAAGLRVPHRLGQVRVQQRLTEPLRGEPGQVGGVVDLPLEQLERHLPLGAVDRRAVADQAHGAREVARAGHLRLEVPRWRWGQQGQLGDHHDWIALPPGRRAETAPGGGRTDPFHQAPRSPCRRSATLGPSRALTSSTDGSDAERGLRGGATVRYGGQPARHRPFRRPE
jgi:hypothetical protein